MPSDDLIEAAPCPNCRSPLTVSVTDLGHLVECPGCGTQFRARRPAEAEPPPRRRDDEPRRPVRDRDRSDEDRDDDRPRGRSRFDDREYDDRDEDDRPRKRGTPGSVTALAVMNFVYAGLLLLCGVVSGLVLALGSEAFGPFGGADQNIALGVAVTVLYLTTGTTALFAGLFALQQKGWALCAVAIGLASVTFLVDLVNVVYSFRLAGGGGPEERTALVCGGAFVVVFWLGYLVTCGILLSKAGRHFR